MSDSFGQSSPAQKKGLSTGAKVAIGCGGVVALGLVLILALAWFAYSKYQATMKPYVDAGYVTVIDEVKIYDSPLDSPIIFIGQSLTTNSDSMGILLVACETANINGTMHGDLDVLVSETLTISNGAMVIGDLNVKGAVQRITIESGAVITGAIDCLAVETIIVESGAIVGGAVTGKIETKNIDPDAKVGSGLPADFVLPDSPFGDAGVPALTDESETEDDNGEGDGDGG